jgi:hypothetical protein
MKNQYSSSPSLSDVTFSGNAATNNGGGMINGDGCDLLLENAIFSGNSANSGGGILNLGDASLINVTMSGNSALNVGGGIWNYTDTLSLTNTILWGNTAPQGPQLYTGSPVTPTISYCLIEDSGGSGDDWDTSLGADGGGNLDDDPQFYRNPDPGDGVWTTLVDNDYGDLHLQYASPAIDHGTNTVCPAFDLDGFPRPVGTFCDMGAYEYQFEFFMFLPQILKMP